MGLIRDSDTLLLKTLPSCSKYSAAAGCMCNRDSPSSEIHSAEMVPSQDYDREWKGPNVSVIEKHASAEHFVQDRYALSTMRQMLSTEPPHLQNESGVQQGTC